MNLHIDDEDFTRLVLASLTERRFNDPSPLAKAIMKASDERLPQLVEIVAKELDDALADPVFLGEVRQAVRRAFVEAARSKVASAVTRTKAVEVPALIEMIGRMKS